MYLGRDIKEIVCFPAFSLYRESAVYVYIYTLRLQFTNWFLALKPDSFVNRISEEKFRKPVMAGLRSNNEINIFGFRRCYRLKKKMLIINILSARRCLRAKINPFSVVKKRTWHVTHYAPPTLFQRFVSMYSFTIILVIIIFTSSKMY